MATSNKSKKILEKARKVAAKTKKKKVSKVDVKKKTTSYPEGQNAPQSKKYTQEADKSLGAKNTGWRWTKEGAKKLGKDANAKPSQTDIETYRNETFKLKGKPNKSGPKGVGDGSHRYLYIERRADKADIKRSQKLAKGGETKDAWGVFYNGKLMFTESSQDEANKSAKMLKSQVDMPFGVSVEKVESKKHAKGGEIELEIKNLDSFDKHYDEVEFTEEEVSLPYQKDGKWFVKTNDKGIAKQLKQDGFVKDSFAKGGYMAKGGITKDELNNFKSYVKGFYGNDEMYAEFFPPTGASNGEIELAIRMYVSYCKTKDDQWGGGDSFDREIVRDVMLYNRGHKKNLEYQRAVKEIVKHYNNKSFEYGGILEPMIGGVNADPRFDIYNTTMFAKKGAELPKGEKMRRGGFVTTMDDLIASDELIDYATAKMKEGDDDQVLNFAYTDYGGDFFDKVAIEFFLENYPDNIVVEHTMYSGKNAIVFGEPAREFAEASERYILGFDNIEDYYYQMQYEQERKDFERFLDDMEKYNNYKVSKEALDWLLENKSGYYSMLTTGLDFSESDLEEELVNEGLLEKNEEMAKGGETRDGKIVKRRYLQGRGKNVFTFGYGMPKDSYDMFGTKGGTEYFIMPNGKVYKKTKENMNLFEFIGTQDDYAKGGKTHEQGYDDREDESLAMRHGKISSKDFVGSHHKKEHSRIDDAQFETRDK